MAGRERCATPRPTRYRTTRERPRTGSHRVGSGRTLARSEVVRFDFQRPPVLCCAAREGRTHEHLGRGRRRRRSQRARHRRLPGARRPEGARARGARSGRRRGVTEETWPGLPGLHGRLRGEPLPAGDRPRPGARPPRLRAPAAQPVVLHALPRRPLAAPGPRPGAQPARGGEVLAARRRAAPRLRGDAGADRRAPSSPRCSRRRPTRSPDALGDLLRLARTGLALPGARPRRAARGRDPDRAGADHPRPLVRVGRGEGDAGDRRHHRGHGLALDAGHRLRALPPRDGRVQRRPRRLGLREGRHGLAPGGDRRGGAGARRRDPHRGPGGPGEGRGRAGHRGGARRRRGGGGAAGGLERRRHRHAARAGRRGAPARRRWRRRSAPSTTRALRSR